MKNNYYIPAALLSVTFLLSGCDTKNEKTGADNASMIAVQVATASEYNSNPFLTASGKVEAVKSANISTRMMGYVDKIHVQVGDSVRHGQLLLSINNADVSAKLAQVNAGISEAQAAFANAEKDYGRFNALFKDNSASQKELDDITAHYNMAKARLEAAEQMKNEVIAQLSYTNIRAPFGGVVTNKFINEGDLANPGMPLLEVEAPGKYQVLALVPESEILGIKNDTEIEVLLKSLNEKIKGKVTEVSTSAKNTGGQYLVKVMLTAPDSKILSGMYATVRFPLERKEVSNAIMIPCDAVVENGQLIGCLYHE